MTDLDRQEREALEEILHKATAPEYAHQMFNQVAWRMREIGEIAQAALDRAREETRVPSEGESTEHLFVKQEDIRAVALEAHRAACEEPRRPSDRTDDSYEFDPPELTERAYENGYKAALAAREKSKPTDRVERIPVSEVREGEELTDDEKTAVSVSRADSLRRAYDTGFRAAREDTCECDSCNRVFPLSAIEFGRGAKAACPECREDTERPEEPPKMDEVELQRLAAHSLPELTIAELGASTGPGWPRLMLKVPWKPWAYPLPWISRSAPAFNRIGWRELDLDRWAEAERDRLCFCCGMKLERLTIMGRHRASLEDTEPQVWLTDGPAGHPRCVALAAEHCPHLREQHRGQTDFVIAFAWNDPEILGYVELPLKTEKGRELRLIVRPGARPLTLGELRKLAKGNPMGARPFRRIGP